MKTPRACAFALATFSLLSACATQRPVPARTMPTATHVYQEKAPKLGTVLLDVVDGPSLVKREAPEPPWPTLCATPCALTLPRGKQKLTLWFGDELGQLAVDNLTIEIGDAPTVHRRSLSRYKVSHRGLYYTGAIVGLVGVGLFSGGLGSMLWAQEPSDLIVPGIAMGSGALLVAVGLVLHAFGGKRLRGSDLVFPMQSAHSVGGARRW